MPQWISAEPRDWPRGLQATGATAEVYNAAGHSGTRWVGSRRPSRWDDWCSMGSFKGHMSFSLFTLFKPLSFPSAIRALSVLMWEGCCADPNRPSARPNPLRRRGGVRTAGGLPRSRASRWAGPTGSAGRHRTMGRVRNGVRSRRSFRCPLFRS